MTLWEALETRDEAGLRAAVRAARDLNEQGAERRTPLIEAAAAGWTVGVRVLLEAGAEPDLRDALGETALLKAAANGHADVVAVLLPRASPDEQDQARAYLKAVHAPSAPEYQGPGSTFGRSVAEVAARAADFVGHDDPRQRLERVERAERSLGKRK